MRSTLAQAIRTARLERMRETNVTLDTAQLQLEAWNDAAVGPSA